MYKKICGNKITKKSELKKIVSGKKTSQRVSPSPTTDHERDPALNANIANQRVRIKVTIFFFLNDQR